MSLERLLVVMGTMVRRGIEMILGTICAAGLLTAFVGLMVFNFAWRTEAITWGLLGVGIGCGISFLSFCVLKCVESDRSTPS